ncbi:phosphoenolpyruvate carboxykinase (ATP) [Caldibacillus debilis]|uniref:phosphoenolpyruvate carboxykinase (ATP) n=1 Tax=Caldibacillus debilis TaxID=301148 RepID=UPI000E382D3E|nr:phosphoenolpyruvate carboxykinase (ATP) [Caldibacillus debilis]REJ30420.1 MAG: phosphoenolpyruvate carboxykinase (ATP) [Caldibacillus debilis]
MNTVSRPNLTKDLKDFGNVHVQLSTPRLVEKILERKEGILTSTGAVRVMTGKYTGRSPKDKYIVEEPSVKDKIDWGTVNQPLPPSRFFNLYKKMVHYLKDKELFLFKGFAGSDPKYRLPIDVYTEFAWHSLFARQLFIRPDENELKHHEARFTLLFAPNFKADPLEDGLRSETFIIISFEHRLVLIGGTEYAGEMKKSIFTVMNYLLPEQGILSMHCSANVGDQGDVALFFGLSGTGKTTLSTDPRRKLIGDDEHGWSDEGIFNIEGGCYAKCIHLSEEKEPQIFRAIGFGSVLENVIVDPVTRVPDYDDASLTENTRAAYPIEAVGNIVKPSVAGHPSSIIFLTADAFGVLPPVAKLTREQAMYHFLSGYTSKLAGTERGVTTPEATFSACYGAPFLPLSPLKYAEMLGNLIDKHRVEVFLVNTGWIGGEYGGGKRISLPHTRAIVHAILEHRLQGIETVQDPIFGLHIPASVPGVPREILNPKKQWGNEKDYEKKAADLARKFMENFKKFAGIPEEIRKKGGPLIQP